MSGVSQKIKPLVTQFVNRFQGDSLKARCARGSLSLTGGAALAKGISFVRMMVLAKLLAGEERGVMIVILPLVTFFETVTDIGIKQSVVQNKEGDTDPYLNMAWWIQSVRGVLLYLVAFLISPILCRIWVYDDAAVHTYSRPELLWMVRVAFLTIIFNGLVCPRAHVLMKHFKFGRSVILVQGSTILGSIITIALAFWLQNVWAFVIGSVGTYLSLSVCSYLMCPFKPSLNFHKKSFDALLKFSKGMFGLPLLTFFAFNLDIFVGKLFVTAEEIGWYGFAVILARMPREILTRIFGPLLIPAFSEKQDDPKAIAAAIVLITKAIGIVCLPLVVFMSLSGKTLLTVVYTPEFESVAVPFALLCVTYMILLLAFPLGKVFFGLGIPGKHRSYVIIRIACLAALIWPAGKFYGLTGIAAAVLISNVIAYIFQILVLKQMVGMPLKRYLLAFYPGALVSCGEAVVVIGASILWAGHPYLILGTGIAGLLILTVPLTGYFVFKLYNIKPAAIPPKDSASSDPGTAPQDTTSAE